MLAEYRDTLDAGAFWYRRLFWEAGLLGRELLSVLEQRSLPVVELVPIGSESSINAFP